MRGQGVESESRMTHPEVREIAEEALRGLVSTYRDYNANYAKVRICTVLKCEDEDGDESWRVEISGALDSEMDRVVSARMRPRMKGEGVEVQGNW